MVTQEIYQTESTIYLSEEIYSELNPQIKGETYKHLVSEKGWFQC